MAKKKKSKNISEIDFTQANEDIEEVTMTKEQYIDLYSSAMANVINTANRLNSNLYNPTMAQNYFQDMFVAPIKVDQKNLSQWLQRPEKNADSLSKVSQYLSNTVMQYRRAWGHFSSSLLYNSELIPLDKIPKKADEKKKYLETYEKKKKIVQKIRPKQTFRPIVDKIMEEGCAFYIINETSDFITLFPLPKKYCYITGRWSLGWTFALDLTFMDTLGNYKDMMPELVSAYETFMEVRNVSGVSSDTVKRMQYYPMNPLKSWCFMFEQNKPDTSPPLKPVFRDATEILSYKDMLKQKTMLDTVSLVVQQMPKDKEGNLKVSYTDASMIAQMTQSMLPRGVKTIVTPCETEQHNFTNSQSQNNIIGLGEELFWRSIGVSGTLMGESSSSALTLKYSLMSDVGFIDHIYNQFSNFMYVQLNKSNKTYKWDMKFFGDRYSNDEQIKLYQSCVQGQNMHIGRLYAMWGYEPHEWENIIELESALGIKDKMKPILQGSQMSSKDQSKKDGKPKKDDTALSDSGMNTRDYDSNANSLKS